MTRFTVTWLPSAENRLADLWLEANDPNAVRAASDQIDRDLRDDPAAKGRQVAGVLRAFAVVPLEVLFRVRDADRKVEVVRVDRI